MESLLSVENLVKHFPISGARFVRAVNGVSFTLAEGETLALVGESGSGKTTVGRCVLGLEDITDGAIYFEGKPISSRRGIRSRELRGRLQLVFQEPMEAFDPRWRLWDSLAEPLRALRVPAAQIASRVQEVTALVGLPEEMLEQLPTELSAGQAQRAGIARALVTDPKLVVLDEPTSALDPTARAEIIDLLRKVQRELGTSFLFISHDLSTVRYLSQRVAIMYLGQIVEQGPTLEVLSRPRHPYSVGLLASVLLPNPNLKSTSGINLKGEIPSPIDLPPGCYLAGRCPFADDRCRREQPPAVDLGDGHQVHCFKHEEVAQTEDSTDMFEEFQRTAQTLLSRNEQGNELPTSDIIS